jgi:hypothetical protein
MSTEKMFSNLIRISQISFFPICIDKSSPKNVAKYLFSLSSKKTYNVKNYISTISLLKTGLKAFLTCTYLHVTTHKCMHMHKHCSASIRFVPCTYVCMYLPTTVCLSCKLNLDPILRLFNLQLQRQRCSSLECFFQNRR